MAVDEKYSELVSEDGMKFPVGFRFDPTDHELVDYYLTRKVCNQPLPNLLLEFDVFQTEPWKLPRDNRTSSKHMRYYFFDIRNRRFENMDARRAGNGEWRIYERNEKFSLSNNQLIGRKNTFVYWRIQGNQALMTQWRMHEFVIGTIFHQTKVYSAVGAYRIFKMKVAKAEKKAPPTVIDFTMEDASVCAPPPSP